ncbi:MAG: UDP-N-acetylglucosamine 1-carboxyvinyltransferase [uncultured bacterium (gcode 4)]|uniref:UDP-N-acetylglucosamine 1-carboxyvinyltransferase n=1 Tax=uncultured bacterium (gcode 4) TaxID=1234023 RepID=K2H2Q4_9BACT|nr:MAG: UDP-N-acetylglucosamine 1-carboxyvinyltransferase [uncultured bacterium (gcode 4)]
MLKVSGWQKLSWTVSISWSKNASLPIIAAWLLLNKVTISNVPRIGDVMTFLDIIKTLWVEIDFQWNTLKMDSTNMNLDNFNRELINKIRVWIFLLPPILQRFWEINIPFPGWCNIWKRPIDEHTKWLVSLGYENLSMAENVHIAWKMEDWEKEIIIDWFSVTATENLIIASVLRPWRTILRLCAIEPHVINLIKFFNSVWAKITLDYDHTIIIDWVEKLDDWAEFCVCSDYIEAWTFMVLWALTSKEYIDIENACILDLKSFLSKLKEAWVRFEQTGDDKLRVYNSIDNLKAVRFQTKVFPWLPTDLQSPLCVLLTQAEWISKVEEVIYEWRLNFLVEIEKMKWHPAILNPHEALIFWKTKLKWATVSSWDLRAWVAMIIAWLIATWDTFITNVEYIERWYEDIIWKMKNLWVQIERVTSD